MDNANLLKAPGYELVNLNVHYKTDLVSDYFKSLSLYLEVRNVFDRTYVASANNIANYGHGAGVQNPASVLANTDRLDLRRFAARLRCRNEGGVQMIDELNRGSKAMLRSGLLATLAVCALANRSLRANEHHQHASEAACEETSLALRVEGHARLRAGWNALAGLDGGRPDLGRKFEGWRPQLFDAGSGDEGTLNLDWGPDARPKIVVDRNGGIALAFSIFRDKAFNGQVLYTRSTDGGKSFAELQPITASNESQRFEALGARCRRIGVCGLARQAQPRSRAAERPEIRRRRLVLRVVEGRRRDLFRGAGWRRTIPASAAASGWRSPDPAVRSSCSGTSLRAASGITRS